MQYSASMTLTIYLCFNEHHPHPSLLWTKSFIPHSFRKEHNDISQDYILITINIQLNKWCVFSFERLYIFISN